MNHGLIESVQRLLRTGLLLACVFAKWLVTCDRLLAKA